MTVYLLYVIGMMVLDDHLEESMPLWLRAVVLALWPLAAPIGIMVGLVKED